jgi:hypothetical protein
VPRFSSSDAFESGTYEGIVPSWDPCDLTRVCYSSTRTDDVLLNLEGLKCISV